MDTRYIKAVFLQFSGIVGAGIFALPYVFYQANPYLLFLLLLVAFVATALINYFYIEIILKTPGDHQISGYTEIYLNSKVKHLSTLNFFMLGIGAFAAYLKLSSEFLVVFYPGLSPLSGMAIFLAFILLLHFAGLKVSSGLHFIIPLITVLLVFVLSFFSLSFSPLNFSPSPVLGSDLFGILLFALCGFTIIPEVEESLRGTPRVKSRLKSASFLGLLLSLFLYLIFSFAVIRISSPYVSIDSITGIITVSPLFGRVAAVIGLTIIGSASLNYLLTFRELFYRDLYLPLPASNLFSAFVPLVSILLTFFPLVKIISLTGSITISVFTLLICLIRYQLPHTPKYILWSSFVLIALYLGLVFEFL
ncbi:MAG TPA: hypothetical protein VF828_01770 [Patescibacteria group bacterium]